MAQLETRLEEGDGAVGAVSRQRSWAAAVEPWLGALARALGCRGHLPVRSHQDPRPDLLDRHPAPDRIRRAAHGARPQLHDRRRRRAPAPPAWLPRAAADGLRRLRPERRERRDQRGRPSTRDHRPQHRVDPPADEAHGVGDRLVARGLHGRARVLPLDAVALPAVLRARRSEESRAQRDCHAAAARAAAGHVPRARHAPAPPGGPPTATPRGRRCGSGRARPPPPPGSGCRSSRWTRRR